MIVSWDIGVNNLSYCILDISENKINIKKWDIIDIKNGMNIKKEKMRIFENIPNILDTIPELLDAKYVVIENQPCMKNPTMKSIQIIVYSYFIIKGLQNKDSNIEHIIFQSASNKLKVYKGPPVEKKYKTKYSQRKFEAVKHTNFFLENDKENFDFFNSKKKKDDLADSYLQGLYFIMKNKLADLKSYYK